MSDYKASVDTTVEGNKNFIKSRNGHDILEVNSYLYHKSTTVRTISYWYCIQKSHKKCRASVSLTGDGKIKKLNEVHNHGPEEQKLLRVNFVEKVKKDVEKFPTISVMKLYWKNINAYEKTDETVALLPDYNSIKGSLYEVRNKGKEIKDERPNMHRIKMKHVCGKTVPERNLDSKDNEPILMESQASSSSSDSQVNPETILPDIETKQEASSGIIIKQEMIEVEEESRSYEFSGNVFHSHETLPTCKSSSVNEIKYDHLRRNSLSSNPNKRTKTSETASADESKDQFDIFGELIASELRNMDTNTSEIVQKVMSELIHEVRIWKHLNDEEKTNLTLKRINLINRFKSVDRYDQIILPNVDEPTSPSDAVLEKSPSIVSDSPSADPEKSLEKENASATQAACYPLETVPKFLIGPENEAKYDCIMSMEQQCKSINSMSCVPATDFKSNFNNLKNYCQLSLIDLSYRLRPFQKLIE